MIFTTRIWVLILIQTASVSCWAGGQTSWQIATGLFNRYVWRGQQLTNEPVLQSSLEWTRQSFTAGLWANLDLTNTNDRGGDMSEIDYYVGWTSKVPYAPATNCELGLIIYDFHGRSANGTRSPDTAELYCTISCDIPFNPSISGFVDLDEAEGCYLSLGLEHSFVIGAKLTTSLGWGNSSYNQYYWGLSEGLFNDLAITLSLPFSSNKWLICPSLSYVTILSSKLRSTEIYGPESHLVVAGVLVQYRL